MGKTTNKSERTEEDHTHNQGTNCQQTNDIE